MEFRILGPLEALSDGQALDLGGAKQRALLAMLLLHANEVVSQDRLIDALWDGEPPETAQKAVQVHVSALRKLLGKDRLETRPPGYLLRVKEGELDLERFRALQGEGRLVEALSLWRGPPLSDFAYRRFAQAEIARLEELRIGCVEKRVERDLEEGRHAELVAELEALVLEHPLREGLRAQLMIALYRSGRQAEALGAYQEARRALVEELGIEPSPELRKLQQAMLNHDPSLDLVPAPQTVASDRGALVGREDELEELLAALGDAVAGRGRVFLLAGEPGIGKTRLADELADHARARGATVLVGRCWEAGGAPAYWPWAQALRVYLREAEPDGARTLETTVASEIAQIVPELHDSDADLIESGSFDPAAARFRLFDAVSSLLRSIARERPLVIVLDDLHAADEPSLLLLRFVARELGSSRLLLVGAYRDVAPALADPLASAVADLVREPVTRRRQLGGLEARDVARYIQLTAELRPDEALVGAIHAETEGNPLFVEEVVRLLAAEGNLGPARGSAPGIPQGVRDAIGRRLAVVSEACIDLLALASVLGREFPLAALERASAVPREYLLRVLDEAAVERLVSEVADDRGRFCFSHALVRDALYGSLPAPRRLRLHRRAAEALEAIYAGDLEPHLGELAHHFLLAGGTEEGKALDYGRRAADQAMTQLAYEEAVRLYRMALEAIELERSGDEGTLCELLLALGDAEAASGQGAESKETFLRATELARPRQEPRALGRAVLGYSGRFAWPRPARDDTSLVPLLEEALGRLDAADGELRARLLARLACALREDPEADRREALSGEAVQIARALGDRATLVYTLIGRRLAVWAPDNLDDAIEIEEEIVQLADEAGDPELGAAARLFRLKGHLVRGDAGRARIDLEAAARLAADTRQPSAQWHVEVHRAELALLEGRFPDAERHIAEMARLGRQAQVSDAAVSAITQTFALRWARGDLRESAGDLERLASEQPRRLLFRCLLAVLHLESGQRALAGQALDSFAADHFASVPRDEEFTLTLALLIDVAAALGEADHAAALYGLLEPYASLAVLDPHEFGTGSAARSLGAAASTYGRLDASELHFREALVVNERMGARLWLARTQEDYALMLAARDRPGDRTKAGRLLADALEAYRLLGAVGWVERASRASLTAVAAPAR